MFGLSLSVGFSSVLVKVIVILVVAAAGEASLIIFKLMIAFRLRKKGSAPLIYKNDTKIFTVRDTVRRLCTFSHLGICFAALLAFGIFPAELATDFGVTVSDKCHPKKFITQGICAAKMRVYTSWDKLYLTSFQVEDAKWDNDMLIRYPVRQGLTKTFSGNEYFGDGVKRNTSLPIVVGNCTVGTFQTLPAKDTSLVFSSQQKSYSDGISFAKILTKNGSTSFRGLGMLCNNNVYYSAFLTQRQKDAVNGSTIVTLFEYPQSDHLETIEKKLTAPNASQELTVQALAPIIMYNLSCGTVQIYDDMFSDAIYAYRFAQLSRSGKRKLVKRTNITVGSESFLAPKPLTESDIVRSVIASKISEVLSCEGETFVYTSCGDYKVRYAMPLAALSSLLIISAIAFKIRQMLTANLVKYPVSSRAWSAFALKHPNIELKYCDIGSEEFEREYAKYGRRDEIGEYFLARGNGRSEFLLRRVVFRDQSPPDQTSEITAKEPQVVLEDERYFKKED